LWVAVAAEPQVAAPQVGQVVLVVQFELDPFE
jgi:hypothetical protein